MAAQLSAEPVRTVGIRWRPDDVVRRAWPIVACTAAIPIMFLLGLHGLVWALPGLVLGARLLRRPSTRVPASALLFAVALLWMLGSVVQVRLPGLPLFAFRWTLFAGALATQVWILNTPEHQIPTQRIVRWLASLWISLVVFGWLATLVSLDMPSPLLRIAPRAVADIEFFESISAWRLAEVQGFLGFPLPRPAAPFPAANGWGCAMGLLFPFFASSWLIDARGTRRLLGAVIAAASLVPIVYSFNRGLWLSLGIAVGYVVVRQVLTGRLRALVLLAGIVLAVFAALSLSPLGDLANQKVETAGDSNESRRTVYDEALDGARESPLIGNGAPRAIRDGLPPAGTHGMVWYLLFVHGFVVTALYLVWLVVEVLRSAPSRSPGSIWFHTALLVALLQTSFYGMLPQVVLVGIAAGLARRAAIGSVDRPGSGAGVGRDELEARR